MHTPDSKRTAEQKAQREMDSIVVAIGFQVDQLWVLLAEHQNHAATRFAIGVENAVREYKKFTGRKEEEP